MRELLARRACLRFAARERQQLVLPTLRSKRLALDGQPIRLSCQTAQLVLQLLDARALHLRRLVGGAERAIKFFPLLLPDLQSLLRTIQCFSRGALRFVRYVHLRSELRELVAQPCELTL